MKKFTLFLPVVLVVALHDAPAARLPIPSPPPPPPAWRCAADPLDLTAGLQRLEWAEQCSLIPGASSLPSLAAILPLPGPTYPIFESVPLAGSGTQLIPLPTLPGSGCSLFARDPVTGNFSRWTSSFYMVGDCAVVP